MIRIKSIRFKGLFFFIALAILNGFSLCAQNNILLNENFTENAAFEKIGKGICVVENGVLISQDAYAGFGSEDWKNYRLSFEAMVPATEDQVQIWFGFREQGRNERYLVGLKGGLQNDIEIGRMGLMGDDAFLGIRNLDFEPALGQWYQIAVEVCKNRIRIFLNNESKPRIDVIDEHADLLPSGRVVLGGSWIKTAFRNLKVVELPENYMDTVKIDEYSYYLSDEQKEEKRKEERKGYEPIVIKNLNATRTEFSLDGHWLFKPGYEVENENTANNPEKADDNWHLIDVPNFWNPSRIWLHGETFMKQNYPKGVSDTYFQSETDRCRNYTFDYEKTKVGWYRQWIDLPETINGKHLELQFDAVSKVAEVFVNGTKAGSNVGMFGAFNIDVTDLVKPGKNMVAVKVLQDYVNDIGNANEIATIAVTVEVTNQMLKDLPHGFYRDNPSGIWQPVKLLVTEPVKIEDVYIKPNLTGASFEVTVKNYGSKKKTFGIHTKITEKNSRNVLATMDPFSKLVLEGGEEKVFTYQLSDVHPKLWSPEQPNLYDFSFSIQEPKQGVLLDETTICSGFRTFETKGDYFYLNGIQYWLRGANHTPHALGINNVALAERTMELYHNGNIAVTRSHTIPYSKVWLDAADKNGVGVSFEGTWPWLMIGEGEQSIPSDDLLKIWAKEWLGLMKKYRNHPSLLYWTINNEMNFTHNNDDFKRVEKKMGIVSDVVQEMRSTDPTRPICFDSGYTRKGIKQEPDRSFFEKFDDGDIDDGHNYSGWYHSSIFDNFNRTPLLNRKSAGRPMITQEWSTGYPNTETGHHTRSYLWQHQNTQTHVGNQAYPFGNPKYSLENNAFLTSELVEAVRRTHETLAGMHNFSSITWFQNVYDAQRVTPYPTYYRMQNSLNPVLVSAELWGRHFYAGESLSARFCIVNDKTDGNTLAQSTLTWEVCYKDNRIISSGTFEIDSVEHYKRKWLTPEIVLPENFSGDRLDGKLRLCLHQNGKVVTKNEYDLLIAKKKWVSNDIEKLNEIILLDFNGQTAPVLDLMGIKYKHAQTLQEAFNTKASLYIISGIETLVQFDAKQAELIRTKVAKGTRVLLLNTGKKAMEIFPEYISNYLDKTMETAHMDIPESKIFDGIEYMDLRYFTNNKAEKPLVYNGLMQVFKNIAVQSLASGCEHRYARIEDRRTEMLSMKGFPIVKIQHGGEVILSEMFTSKGIYDPIAARLLANMIREMQN